MTLYYQEFNQGSQPAEVIVNPFGSPVQNVNWNGLSGTPNMFGFVELQVLAGNNANEGVCLTTRSKLLRRNKNKFGFRFFNFNLEDLRYHLGAFKTLSAHGESARYALAFNGSALGLLVTDSNSNIFYTLDANPAPQVYEVEFEFVSGGIKCTLMNGDGSSIGSVTVTNEIPPQNEQLYFGACIWSSATIDTPHVLPIDNWWVDTRSST